VQETSARSSVKEAERVKENNEMEETCVGTKQNTFFELDDEDYVENITSAKGLASIKLKDINNYMPAQDKINVFISCECLLIIYITKITFVLCEDKIIINFLNP
jgi:hypothetical protein